MKGNKGLDFQLQTTYEFLYISAINLFACES